MFGKADFRDRASVVRAFAGVDKVLVISTRFGSDVVSEYGNAVEAGVPDVMAEMWLNMYKACSRGLYDIPGNAVA